MHCDVLVGEDVEASNIPVIHEPPRRVFTRLPGTSGLTVSDYLYPGEGREMYIFWSKAAITDYVFYLNIKI